VKPEDVAPLSPLVHEHINVLGRDSLTVSESIARGNLRPLNQPDEAGDQGGYDAAQPDFQFR
jgi:hypothetical protein